jgi:hypothetical protein
VLLSTDKLLQRAAELVEREGGVIRSRQIKALAQAIVEAINHELMNPIVVQVTDEETDAWDLTGRS